jgi:ABC-2 type transport system ATP-binding protein
MRAWEYLDYVGRLYKMPASLRKNRINEVLEKVNLKDAKKRKIAGFSGGMKQRLGIAQAILHEPKVLLLDEPTSALDPAGRYEVLDWIKNLNGETTVFLSSHILGDIERICDQIAILHNGKLVRSGDRETILSDYAVNAVDIEVDPISEPALSDVANRLAALPWVEQTLVDHRSVRVMVSDIQTGKMNLMQAIQDMKLSIARVEWVRPSLEQVFLELSE